MNSDIKKDQHFWHLITASTFGLLSILLIMILNNENKIPSSIPLFDFFMLTLATFRVTRLLVHDLVSDFIRDRFESATHGLGLSMHDLLDCPWCTGAWVSLGIGYVYFLLPMAWPILLALAVAGFGTLLTILASLMMVSLEGK
jgi:hypothetical protein